MQLSGLIYSFPKTVKQFLIMFILMLSVGFYTGLLFVSSTTENTPNGIEENYLGNEENESAKVMKFKKSDRELLTTIHTHVLSLSFIFFMQGLILLFTSIPNGLKKVLLIEPFLSIIMTFGGIYLLWKGILWMKYLIMLSGGLMTLCFTISSIIILIQLLQKSPK